MDGSTQVLSLEEVARRLEEEGITWAVFAGAAAVAYGSARPLTDLDILVPSAEGVRLAALFPEAEVQGYENGLQGIRLPGFDILAGLPLLDLDAPMAARLTRHQILGVAVPVIPAEDNILLKAMWGRGAEQGKHDWEDVEAMMAHLPALDWDYLRWRAGTIGPTAQMQPVLEHLEGLWRQRSTMDRGGVRTKEVG